MWDGMSDEEYRKRKGHIMYENDKRWIQIRQWEKDIENSPMFLNLSKYLPKKFRKRDAAYDLGRLPKPPEGWRPPKGWKYEKKLTKIKAKLEKLKMPQWQVPEGEEEQEEIVRRDEERS